MARNIINIDKDKFKNISSVLTGLGKFLMLDDQFDIGKFSYKAHGGHPDHPSKLHHWQLGYGLEVAGKLTESITDFFSKIAEFNKLDIPKTKENFRKWIQKNLVK